MHKNEWPTANHSLFRRNWVTWKKLKVTVIKLLVCARMEVFAKWELVNSHLQQITPPYIVFNSGDPNSQDAIVRFGQEWQFLRDLHHPHVIQYLGTFWDKDTGLPVVLMELMCESLTHLASPCMNNQKLGLDVMYVHVWLLWSVVKWYYTRDLKSKMASDWSFHRTGR